MTLPHRNRNCGVQHLCPEALAFSVRIGARSRARGGDHTLEMGPIRATGRGIVAVSLFVSLALMALRQGLWFTPPSAILDWPIICYICVPSIPQDCTKALVDAIFFTSLFQVLRAGHLRAPVSRRRIAMSAILQKKDFWEPPEVRFCGPQGCQMCAVRIDCSSFRLLRGDSARIMRLNRRL